MRINNRQLVVEKLYNKHEFFSINSMQYFNFFKQFIDITLTADLADNGDISTQFLNDVLPSKVKGQFIAKSNGVFSGAEEVKYICKKQSVSLSLNVNDGDDFKIGDVLFVINATPCKLLEIERTILNLIQRMSGIATMAAQFNPQFVKIAVTRKTPIPLLDKKAAIAGGAFPHRINLSDAIMIKDTHLDQINRNFTLLEEKLVNFIDSNYLGASFIEIEVENKKEAMLIATISKKINLNIPIVVMLDNFSPLDIVETVKELIDMDLHHYVLIEVSGGVLLKNYELYDVEGVDVVSIGEITHSVKVSDVSMKIL